MKPLFALAVVGGTFDHFHKGHKFLLETVFSQSKKVTIGVSTDKLYKHKKYTNLIENYEQRVKYVENYINKYEIENTIIPIDDIFGPTITDKDIDAIFLTEENKSSADLINAKRTERGFRKLEIIVVPLLKACDGKHISSDRIRKGEINREGLAYKSLFGKQSMHLPEKLRAKLRKPIGTITTNITTQFDLLKSASMVVSVGDIVTCSLAAIGHQADISIIDFKTRRHELKTNEKSLLESIVQSRSFYTNAAGKIETKAVEAFAIALAKFEKTARKQTISIKGEEDLLALPAILLSPLGAIVVYGQYDEGAVFVEVTEQKKHEIVELINQFE